MEYSKKWKIVFLFFEFLIDLYAMSGMIYVARDCSNDGETKAAMECYIVAGVFAAWSLSTLVGVLLFAMKKLHILRVELGLKIIELIVGGAIMSMYDGSFVLGLVMITAAVVAVFVVFKLKKKAASEEPAPISKQKSMASRANSVKQMKE